MVVDGIPTESRHLGHRLIALTSLDNLKLKKVYLKNEDFLLNNMTLISQGHFRWARDHCRIFGWNPNFLA